GYWCCKAEVGIGDWSVTGVQTWALPILNGVAVDVRLGDCSAPVRGERFDLICSTPPQMPTPSGRERADAVAAADNGGVDGWRIRSEGRRVGEGRRSRRSPGRRRKTRKRR